MGLETENAYLMACKQVLPAGLLGLILTGMYFSTSASANTALNVVSAVFTNDIYKGTINSTATEEKLMKVARNSSWAFGFGMIGVGLIVPYIGGIVEFTLSIGAITGGPLLAPPIWALFSKRLTGRATIIITLVSLGVNLICKIILPLAADLKLNRATEMLVGVLLPFFLLLIYEMYATSKGIISKEYLDLQQRKSIKHLISIEADPEELAAVKAQNLFGLKMISFSLAFIGCLLFLLCLFTSKGIVYLAIVAGIVMLSSFIPFSAYKKAKHEISIQPNMVKNNSYADTSEVT